MSRTFALLAGLLLAAGSYGAGRGSADRSGADRTAANRPGGDPVPSGRPRTLDPPASGLRQAGGVAVGPAEEAVTPGELRLAGRVVPDETRVRVVSAGVDGSVVRLSGVTTGSRVRRGQWLGSFFSAEIRPALQAHLTALDVQDQDPYRDAPEGVRGGTGASASGAASFAVERLLAIGVSRAQLDEMARTRTLPLTIDLYAPVDGVVLERAVAAGQAFDRGAPWFRIAALDRVWVLADAPPGLAPLPAGTAARVALPGRPGTLPATVDAVDPGPDPLLRRPRVRLRMVNPGLALRPDQPVEVVVPLDRAAVSVPVGAVVDTGRRRTVFVESAPGTFEPRSVVTGWRVGDRVEIASGLAPGERVALSAAFLVDAETRMPGVR